MSPVALSLTTFSLFGLLLLEIGTTRRTDGSSALKDPSAIILAALVAINGAGIAGIVAIFLDTLRVDGVSLDEGGLFLAPVLVVAGITFGSYQLRQRGGTAAAIWVCAITATAFVIAFLGILYLDSHPIDMR